MAVYAYTKLLTDGKYWTDYLQAQDLLATLVMRSNFPR